MLVRATKAAKPGSCEQRDLVAGLERLRAKKQGPAVSGVASHANGLPKHAR